MIQRNIDGVRFYLFDVKPLRNVRADEDLGSKHTKAHEPHLETDVHFHCSKCGGERSTSVQECNSYGFMGLGSCSRLVVRTAQGLDAQMLHPHASNITCQLRLNVPQDTSIPAVEHGEMHLAGALWASRFSSHHSHHNIVKKTKTQTFNWRRLIDSIYYLLKETESTAASERRCGTRRTDSA